MIDMTTTDAPDRILTTGALAKRLGCEPWHVLRAVKAGMVPEPPRCGPFRCWREADVESVRAAMVQLGYLERQASHGREGLASVTQSEEPAAAG